MTMDGYDIIGDVHGCADKLKGLLRKLGYENQGGAYSHPKRSAIFVGDLIDRGEQQVETLKLVRAMVEAESAQVVMGNHEFNAISYDTRNPELPGDFMRPHTDKNQAQHEAFINQVRTDTELCDETIRWFRTLPLFLDLDGLRVVHACWNDEAIRTIKQRMTPNTAMSTEFVIKSNQEKSDEHRAIEVLLKGPELNLRNYGQPDFRIPGDHLRHEARIRWWNATAHTLSELVEIAPGTTTETGEPYPDLPDKESTEEEKSYDYPGEKPVFYGHYWRTGEPTKDRDWTAKTACVDFSAVRGGPLFAYQWSGESEIVQENYVKVEPELSKS